MRSRKEFLLTSLKFIFAIAAVIVLIFSSQKLYSYNKERINSQRLADKVTSASSSEQAVPITVDFEKLNQENNDIIAWLYCEKTPINYPVVKAQDNSYYLRRGLDRKYSLSGTLFADYLNNSNFTDNLTIIYGHNMKNDTMFGTLTKYVNQEYFDEYQEMHLMMPDKKFKVTLIAGATVNSTSSIYKLPLNDEEKEAFISELRQKSTFKSEYTFSPDDKFVMFSTCSYEYSDARYVLIGLLNEL